MLSHPAGITLVMEMNGLFDTQERIRTLSAEHRRLVGDDEVGRRRSEAIRRHRRRMDAAPKAEREERLAVRRSFSVVR